MFARTAEDIEPLGEYLAKEMPARVRSPGEIIVYSNHGTTLAGYIVEEVSGMPFEDYIEENIYRPFDTSQTRRTLYEITRFRKISTNGRLPIQIASDFGPNELAQQWIKGKSKISANSPIAFYL